MVFITAFDEYAVRAFDVCTGKLEWSFNLIPRPGEPGHETSFGNAGLIQREVDKARSIPERFLIRWRGEADPKHVKAIDAYWSSAAEHGMNASTFTARVIASTGADVADQTGPLLTQVNTTIGNVNTALGQVHTSLDGVNLQLARIDAITNNVQHISTNVATISEYVV